MTDYNFFTKEAINPRHIAGRVNCMPSRDTPALTYEQAIERLSAFQPHDIVNLIWWNRQVITATAEELAAHIKEFACIGNL
jgi:hypothetical protein